MKLRNRIAVGALGVSAIVLGILVALGIVAPRDPEPESSRTVQHPCAADAELPELGLIRCLQSRTYKALDDHVRALQTAYEKNMGTDTTVELALRALANSAPEHEALLSEWIREHPDSFAAHAVRGHYYADLAWTSRGEKFVRDTSPERMAKMRYYNKLAMDDLQTTTKLNPRFIVAYADIIDVARVTGQDRLALDALTRALNIDPASYEIRKSYLLNLHPSWGGSFESISEFLADTAKYIPRNARLKPLLGYADYARGKMALSHREYKRAIEHFDDAIEHGETSWYLEGRGSAYYWTRAYDAAQEDYDRALEAWPANAKALHMRGWVFKKTDRNDEALRNFKLAAELRPVNKEYPEDLAYALAKQGLYDDALRYLEASLKLDSEDAHTRYSLAWYANRKVKNHQLALDHLDILISMKPAEAAYHHERGRALYHLRDCRFTSALEEHLRLCGESTHDRKACKMKFVDWSKQAIDKLTTDGTCP